MKDMHTERALVNVTTGTTAVQYREENLLMTVIVHGKALGDLHGKALITLGRVTVLICDDDRWQGVIGKVVCLEGGTELDVDNDRLDEMFSDCNLADHGLIDREVLIPVIIRDIYMPRLRALIPWKELVNRVNVTLPGEGARSSGDRVLCKSSCGSCLPCFYEKWIAVEIATCNDTDTDKEEPK